MAASQDNSDHQNVPQWKRELILRRRALSRTLPAGNSSVQLTCPSVVAAVRQAEVVVVTAAAGGENVSDLSSSPPQQRCISTSTAVNKSSPESLPSQVVKTDFHPGCSSSTSTSSSSVVVSVLENMRLVEHELSPGNRRSLTNGVCVVDSNKSSEPAIYRSIMGEEKSVKKSCANRKVDSASNNNMAKGIDLVLGDHNNCSHPKDEECQSDSSEELQYGPGIVKKLKSKYMSMTLRENKNKGVRPSLSQLRRATSLENMLDNEENETGKPPLIKAPQKFTKRTEATNNATNKSQYTTQHQQRYRSGSRGNESIKRARSVEALLRYEAKPTVATPLETKRLLKSLSKDDIVIVEKSPAVRTEEKPPVAQTAVSRKKRQAMNSTQKTGLPPSDLVKQTLKIFETSQAKPAPKVNGTAMAKLNINIANQKPAPGSNKPLLSPKPSPEKIRRSPLSQSPKKVIVPPTIDQQIVQAPVVEAPTQRKPPSTIEIQRIAPTVVGEAQRSPITPSRVLPLDLKPVQLGNVNFSSPVLKMPSPVASAAVPSPTNGVVKSPVTPPVLKSPVTPPVVTPRTPSPGGKSASTFPKAHTPSPEVKARTFSPDLKASTFSSSLAPDVKARTVSPVQVRTPSPVTNGKPSILDDEEDETDGALNQKISTPAMEGIRKGGSTIEFSFCKNVASNEKPKSHLPNASSRVAPVVPVAASPLPETRSLRYPNPMSPLPVSKSPDSPSIYTKQVGVIRPTVSSAKSLTEREIENNRINRDKSSNGSEQPTTKLVVSFLQSEVVVGNVSESLKGRVCVDDSAKPKKEVKSYNAVNANEQKLWDQKRPWNQQKTSEVFNFTQRKEIPDYIENDGIIRRSKREPIRAGDSGLLYIGPGPGESPTETETDDFNCSLGPPSPCNVHFEGDNVVINGKSNLRKQPNKKTHKLHITFNDGATQLFEYPSESSLLNDALNSSSAGSSGLPIPPPPSGPTPGLPVPSGGSSLASYTSKVSMGSEDFQLGVSRTTPLPKPKEMVVEPSTASSTSNEVDSPAWSTDTADDLLF